MTSRKIRSIMIQKNISITQLAKNLGILPQSLSNKFYRNTFTVKELITILDYLDCKLVIESGDDMRIVLCPDD
jgi:transcriptional regulator with XRE-family HTH domain